MARTPDHHTAAGHPLARLLGLLMLVLMAHPLAAQADLAPPESVLEAASVEMLDLLDAKRDQVREEPHQLFVLVESVLGPHVDFDRMSRWVLGKHWRTASPEQRERFQEVFRLLLVRFYTAALLEEPGQLDELLANRDGLIRYEPTRVGDSDRVNVRSTVTLPNGQEVPVIFAMHSRDGRWKVYDVTVEGISLVSNYRSSFSQQIARQGLNALIEEIDSRNHALLEKTRNGQLSE